MDQRSRAPRFRLITLGRLALLDHSGAEEPSLSVRRRKLALLAWLILRGRRATRDQLIGTFWGARDESRARNSLSDALSHLRSVLGRAALPPYADEIVLAGDTAIDVDALELTAAATGGDHDRVVALYAGPFLDGVFIEDASEFDHWRDGVRARLDALFVKSARECCTRLYCAQSWSECAHLAERWLAVSPASSEGALYLMNAVAAPGTADAFADAVAAYERWALRLEREIGSEPPAAARERAEELRALLAAAPAPTMPRARPVPPMEPAARRSQRPIIARRVIAAMTTVVAGALVAAAAFTRAGAADASAPLIAVGVIRDYSTGDTAATNPAASDLLATNLARVPNLKVLSEERLQAVMSDSALRGIPAAAAIVSAARRAGAAELIEGSLHRDGEMLRLALRRVRLSDGTVQNSLAVRAANLFEIVDSATLYLQGSAASSRPALRVADVTTSSATAYRLYNDGLRAIYRERDNRKADALLSAAIEEDSLFALAYFYRAIANRRIIPAPHNWEIDLGRAVQLRTRVTDRERLTILIMAGVLNNEPAAIAYGDTLNARYPTSLEGKLAWGQALMGAVDFTRVRQVARSLIAVGDAGSRAPRFRCWECEGYALEIRAATFADDHAAAERAAREWVRRDSTDDDSWGALAGTLELQERYAEADAALERYRRAVAARRSEDALRLPGERRRDRARVALRDGDYERADSLLRQELAEAPTPAARQGTLWWLAFSSRNQGRPMEAVAFLASADSRDYATLLHRYTALMEAGRSRDAARALDSVARSIRDTTAWASRLRTWAWSHAASAWAAAGDTSAVNALFPRLETDGARSIMARDQRAHHYARGLVLAAQGKLGEAADEYRRSIASMTFGFTRENFELGRTLLALNQPRAAAEIVAPALRGDLDVSNLYVTRTELRETLARAFDASGQLDSARKYYRLVAGAWAHAEPSYRTRGDTARRRLAMLESR